MKGSCGRGNFWEELGRWRWGWGSSCIVGTPARPFQRGSIGILPALAPPCPSWRCPRSGRSMKCGGIIKTGAQICPVGSSSSHPLTGIFPGFWGACGWFGAEHSSRGWRVGRAGLKPLWFQVWCPPVCSGVGWGRDEGREMEEEERRMEMG